MIAKFDHAVIRTSVLPYLNIQSIFNSNTDEWVSELLSNDYFLTALSLASPELLKEALRVNKLDDKGKDYPKLRQSLLKYAARMSTRCTPFGLFSGVGVIPIKENQTNSSILIEDKKEKHFRLDMNFSVQLASEILKHEAIRENSNYYVNTSLYQLGDNFRLINYTVLNKMRSYDLILVERNEYLDQILKLAEKGTTKKKLVEWLIKEDIEKEEAKDYIVELIDSQLLISELEPSTIGLEVEFQLLKGLKNIIQNTENKEQKNWINTWIIFLEETTTRLDALNTDKQLYEDYQFLIDFLLEKTPVKIDGLDAKFLIQCNLSLSFNKNSSITFEQEKIVQKAMQITNYFQFKKKDHSNTNLGLFKTAFQNRYEGHFVPLIEVLDAETGIGFGERANKEIINATPLLENIPIGGEESENDKLDWHNKMFSFWLPKFNKANNNHAFSTEITDQELKDFEKIPSRYSSTFTAKAGFFKNGDEDLIHFEFYGGPTAATWYGRFCNGNKKLKALNQEIIDYEQTNNQDCIIAEINHLPESRLGNVIHRAQSRAYQIKYLASYNSGQENEISISDLLIGVRQDKIVLLSKSLNREVRVYHSNSFNTDLPSNIPLFQFLASLMDEHNQAIGTLNFSPLHKFMKFIPRLTYQNIIFQRAKWKFEKKDFEAILKEKGKERIKLFKAFREKWLLPTQFVIMDGDNELLIDVNNADSSEILFATIKSKYSIELSEFLLASYDSAVKDKNGNSFNNEVLINYKMQSTNNQEIKHIDKIIKTKTQQIFHPGSEWLYYKIYLGAKSADKLLLTLKPQLDELIQNNIIDKWFFIRYTDPDMHLRLRLKLIDTKSIGNTMNLLSSIFDSFGNSFPIDNIVLETYRREMDRYGYDCAPLFESIFYHDSKMSIDLIHHCEAYESMEKLWLTTLYAIDSLCTLFQLDIDEKDKFLTWITSSFKSEFHTYSETTKSFNKKYNDNKKMIHSLFLKKERTDFYSFVEIIEERDRNITPYIKEIIKQYPDINDRMRFLSSTIHMAVNRQFRTRQRMYEFLISDFLKRITTTLKYVKN